MKKAKSAFTKIAALVRDHRQHILAAILVMAAIGIVYWQDLIILTNEALQNEAVSHILLVPFFIAFLLYRKRELIKANTAMEKLHKKRPFYLDEIAGAAVCIVAFLLYWYGSYTFYPLEYHILSLPIFVAGTILILLGSKNLMALALPVFFLIFLVPPPTEITYAVGGALANLSTQVSYTVLSSAGVPVTLQSTYGPPTIGVIGPANQPLSFAVDLPCSGMYSLMAFLMFATFLTAIIVTSIPKKAGIFALGFVVFSATNTIRIMTIVSVGHVFGEEIAMTVFHTAAGWVLILAGMFFILFVAERFWKVQITQPPQVRSGPACSTCEKISHKLDAFCSSCGRFLGSTSLKLSSRFWAKLLLLVLGVYLATMSIQAPTFVIAKGPVQVTSNPNWENATNTIPELPNYQLRFLYRDVNYEKISGQDVSLVYAYTPNNQSDPVIYVDIGVADTVSKLHNWEVCLVTWQTSQGHNPLVSVLDSRDIQLLEGVSLIARYLTFVSPANYTQVTLYWYEQATFNTGITVAQKFVRISLFTITPTSANYQQLENQLLPVAQSIASYWEPLRNQSIVSVGIPIQQSLLVSAVAFVAFTATFGRTREWRAKANNSRIFNNHASSLERTVLRTVQELNEKPEAVTTSLVATALTNENLENTDLTSIRTHQKKNHQH
jgi:exosortase